MKSIWPRILRFCFRFMKRKAMLFSIPSWRSFLGNMAFLVWMLQFSSYIWILIKPVSTFKSFGWLLHYVDILSSAVRSFVDERSVVIHICSREALNSRLARAAYSIFTLVSNLSEEFFIIFSWAGRKWAPRVLLLWHLLPVCSSMPLRMKDLNKNEIICQLE